MSDLPSPVPASDRVVRLAAGEHGLLVLPRDASEPFLVPQLPMSQVLWLDGLARVFLRTRHRCLAVALMLDEQFRAWTRPEIPTQSCGREGVRWAWRAGDFAERLLRVRIGGSYQSALVRDVHEARALVPACDGVHLVGAAGPEQALYVFAHAEGQTFAIQADRFVVDDVAAALDSNADRLSVD